MWKLEFSKRADKQLGKMNPGVRRMLLAWLLKNIDGCADPRAHGKSLTGNKSGKWRYRIGDYRILCEIQDDALIVLAIEIGHRKDMYRK